MLLAKSPQVGDLRACFLTQAEMLPGFHCSGVPIPSSQSDEDAAFTACGGLLTGAALWVGPPNHPISMVVDERLLFPTKEAARLYVERTGQGLQPNPFAQRVGSNCIFATPSEATLVGLYLFTVGPVAVKLRAEASADSGLDHTPITKMARSAEAQTRKQFSSTSASRPARTTRVQSSLGLILAISFLFHLGQPEPPWFAFSLLFVLISVLIALVPRLLKQLPEKGMPEVNSEPVAPEPRPGFQHSKEVLARIRVLSRGQIPSDPPVTKSSAEEAVKPTPDTGLAETQLRVDLTPELQETQWRGDPRAPEAEPQSTLASMSLSEIAQRHACAYQIVNRLAQGSVEQAESFRAWLGGYHAEPGALATHAAGPTVTIVSPTGPILWRELSHLKYRFLVITEENGYLIPRLAKPVPEVSDFVPPSLPIVQLVV